MRRVTIVTFDDAQILDVTGPGEVFGRTARIVKDAYRVELVGLERGPVVSSSGMKLLPDRTFSEHRGPIDTLIVAGGRGTEAACRNHALLRWLGRKKPRRLASVCTGAFVLAAAGLLDGKRATTHWASCTRLAERHPLVRLEPDAIYVRDGAIWTSAGVTAGMDLALAMVEEDHGREIALEVARALVLFLRRPGGQSQFSAQLEAQVAEREPIRNACAWAAAHPSAELTVHALAKKSGMSPRNFARVFQREMGTTPAKFVLRTRVEAARLLLEDSRDDLESIAARTGFGSAEVMRRAFQSTLHVPPRAYRERFPKTERRPS
jgi:transcriptional regulator GlxA family with amidase domain